MYFFYEIIIKHLKNKIKISSKIAAGIEMEWDGVEWLAQTFPKPLIDFSKGAQVW